MKTLTIAVIASGPLGSNPLVLIVVFVVICLVILFLFS